MASASERDAAAAAAAGAPAPTDASQPAAHSPAASSAPLSRCRFCFQRAPASSLRSHPLARRIGLPDPCMCSTCHQIYTAGRWKWKLNAKGKDEFCRMCGEGDLGSVTCDRDGCVFMFCEGCILANCGQRSFEQITSQADNNCWHCFVCTHSGPSGSSDSAPLNRIRRFLHLSARAAAGGFSKRTIFNSYEIHRRVRGFTYFDRERLDRLRHGRRGSRSNGRAGKAAATEDGSNGYANADACCMEDGAASTAASTAAASSAAAQVAAAPASAAWTHSRRHHSCSVSSKQRTPPRSARAAATALGAPAPSASLGAGSLSVSSLPCDIPDKPCSRTGYACDSELDEGGDSNEDVDEDEEPKWTHSPAASATSAPSPSSSSSPPLKKLIVFSFFLHELHAAASHTPYVVGLLENLRRVWAEWSGWTVRIYVDDSFQLPAPAETMGASPNTDGLACKSAYHSAMRNVWYGVLGPLLRRMEARGVLVEVRRFHWPLFQDKDRVHHGLVGTLARFLALADLGREASHVVLADTDNLLTPAARQIVETNQKEHQRFHDPRYPIPVWAGGFSARVPAHALLPCDDGACATRGRRHGQSAGPYRLNAAAGWVNPYERIESWVHRWAVEHCKDPLAIHSRPEMFREDRGGNCTVSAAVGGTAAATAAGAAERAEAGRRRARQFVQEEEERRRDREADMAQARAVAQAQSDVSSRMADRRNARDATPLQQAEKEEEHKAPVAPSHSSSASDTDSASVSAPPRSDRLSGATAAQPSSGHTSQSKARQEHKEQRRPRTAHSDMGGAESDGGSGSGSGNGACLRSDNHSSHASGDTAHEAAPLTSSQEKRRSSRAHLSSLAREKEEEMMGTSAHASAGGGAGVVITPAAAAAASPAASPVSDAEAGDDGPEDMDVPPLVPMDSAQDTPVASTTADADVEGRDQAQPTHVAPPPTHPAPEAAALLKEEEEAGDRGDEDDDECVEITRPQQQASEHKTNEAAGAVATAAAGKGKQRSSRNRKASTARGSQRTRRTGTGAGAGTTAGGPSPSSSSCPFPLPPDPDSGDDSLLIFFPYGCDQVFLADYVWPIMRRSCETTYALLPTGRLKEELKVWPPSLSAEEERLVATAPRYWSLMDWLPNGARPPPLLIERFVKTFIATKWALMLAAMCLDQSAYDPPRPGVRYVPAATMARRIERGETQVHVPFANANAANPNTQAITRTHSHASARSGRKGAAPVTAAASSSSAAAAAAAASAAARSDAIVLDDDDGDESMFDAQGSGDLDGEGDADADADADAVSVSSRVSGGVGGARGRAAAPAATATKRSSNGKRRASAATTGTNTEQRKGTIGASNTGSNTGTPQPRVLPPRRARRALSQAQLGEDGDDQLMLDLVADMGTGAGERFGEEDSPPSSPRAPRPPPLVPEVVRLSDSPVPDADAVDTGIYAYDEEAPSGASSAADDDEDEPLVLLDVPEAKTATAPATASAKSRPSPPTPTATPSKRAKIAEHAAASNASTAATSSMQSQPESASMAVTVPTSQGPARKTARVRRVLVVSDDTATLITPSTTAPASSSTRGSAPAAPSRASAPRLPVSSASHSAHYTDECEWGCRRLHDATACQTALDFTRPGPQPEQKPLLCSNHVVLLESASDAFRALLARGHEHATVDADGGSNNNSGSNSSSSSSVPMDVVHTQEGGEEESKTDLSDIPAPSSAAGALNSRPATPEPAACDREPSGGAPMRERSSRTKKVAERLGDFVVAHPRRTAPGSTATTGDAASIKQARVSCVCTCDFCAPPPLHLSELGASGASSSSLRHPSLPSFPWPWDHAGLVEWLASLQLETLMPLQVLLSDATPAVAKLLQTGGASVRPGVMHLLAAHPTRLLRLLHAAHRDYGTSSDCVPELLAWSLHQKLQGVAHTMRYLQMQTDNNYPSKVR